MSDGTDPGRDHGGVTYARWLQDRIAQQATGINVACGPDVIDPPTLAEQIFPYTRPNWEAEQALEAKLYELEHQPRQPEPEASIG
jgi:hypothetical protein